MKKNAARAVAVAKSELNKDEIRNIKAKIRSMRIREIDIIDQTEMIEGALQEEEEIRGQIKEMINQINQIKMLKILKINKQKMMGQ